MGSRGAKEDVLDSSAQGGRRVARPTFRKRLLDAAKALEFVVKELGPNPLDQIEGWVNPIDPSPNPEIGQLPPCGPPRFPKRRPGQLRVVPISPAVGLLPPCGPIPPVWIQELQVTLLENAAWLRHLATARLKPARKPPSKRPKPGPRPKRARRKTGR